MCHWFCNLTAFSMICSQGTRILKIVIQEIPNLTCFVTKAIKTVLFVFEVSVEKVVISWMGGVKEVINLMDEVKEVINLMDDA